MSKGGVRQVPRRPSRASPQGVTNAGRGGSRETAAAEEVAESEPSHPGTGPASWAQTAARILLGLVFAWFGAHELLQPHLWTGYVPVLPPTSTLATWAVLAHGGLLLVLAMALVFGVAPRLAAAGGVLVMVEIVISLGVQGPSDIVARDVGILALTLAVAGQRRHRVVLTR